MPKKHSPIYLLALGIGVALFAAAFASPAFAQTSSIFAAATTDIAQGWLNYLFNGQPMPSYANQAGTAEAQNMNIQSAFISALACYSDAILVIAGFILFYHLTAMTVETAHHGTPMGKRASQIWAPIRLVVALGLLVPINGGLSAGQEIVVKAASMGSGLASTVWGIVLQSVSTYSAATVPPSNPLVAQQAMDIIEMKACQAAFNARWACLGQSLPALKANQIANPTPVKTTIGNVSGTKYSFTSPALVDQDICGSYFIPNAPSEGALVHDAEVSALQQEIDGDFSVAGLEILQVMPDIANCSATNGLIGTGGGNITLNPYVTTAVQNYENAVASAVNSTYKTIDNGLMQQATQTVAPLGWVFAGTFLNTIDRMQGDIARIAQSGLPTTTVPSVDEAVAVAHAGATDHIRALFNNNDPSKDADIRAKVSTDLQNFHVLSKQELAAAPECASMVGLNNDAEKWYQHAGAKAADLVFGMLDYLAQMNGVWSIPDTQKCGMSTAASGKTTFTVGVQIGGADPFAQMAALGHANLNTAFDLLAIGVGGKALGSLATLAPNLMGSFGGYVSSGIGGLFVALALVFFACGFTLSYLIPLMPFLRFLFSVVAWVGAIIEGVIFVPMMALAHLTPEGEGLAGEAGKTGWYFIFNLFLRPVLTIFGLVAGLLVFYIALAFLNFTYDSLVSGSGATVNGMESLSRLIYSVLYVIILYIVSNHAFMLIDHTPAHALQWLGRAGQNIQAMGETGRMEVASTAVSTLVARDFMGAVGRKSDEVYGAAKRRSDAARMEANKAQLDADKTNTINVEKT